MADEPAGTESLTPEAGNAADRAAFLAEMRGPAEEKPANVEAKPAAEDTDPEPAEEETDAAESTDEAAAESTDEAAADEDSEDAKPETDNAEPEAEPADGETNKRLAAVQKAERRAKEQLATERTKLHAELDARHADIEKQWAPRVEAAKKFESLKERVRYNTVAVLRELGLTEDDFERAGQEIYAHSKAAGVKPEHRAHSERAARERELSDELKATKKRQDDLEKQLADRDTRATAAASAERYLTSLEKAVGDRTPLAKHFLDKNPIKYRLKLAALTDQLWEETGARPEPLAVLKRFEKVQREELEELGVDPTAFIKSPAKKTIAVNGKPVIVETKKPANGKAVAAPAKKPAESAKELTDEEERELILQEIREQREAAQA